MTSRSVREKNKVTNIVYFTYLPRSPRSTDRHQIWFGGWFPGRNQTCQISLKSVQGFRFHRRSNFGLSHRNEVSPLTQGLNYRSACDFSDHRPINICCTCTVSRGIPVDYGNANKSEGLDRRSVFQLRWDHAHLLSYYAITGWQLQSVLSKLIELERRVNVTLDDVNDIYYQVIEILRSSADCAVPSYRKNFLKFWWDQEMGELKVSK